MAWVDDLLQKVYDSQIGTTIRESSTLFPWLESLHVLAITTVLGTIAIIDLRLLGYWSHRRGVKRLGRDLLPFTWVAFAFALATGLLLFSSNTTAYWANTPFKAKMVVLVLAGINMLVFHSTFYRSVDQWDEQVKPPTAARVAGALSLTLWIGVIFLGRWIGFTL